MSGLSKEVRRSRLYQKVRVSSSGAHEFAFDATGGETSALILRSVDEGKELGSVRLPARALLSGTSDARNPLAASRRSDRRRGDREVADDDKLLNC
jgi:hypothetical protein